MQYGQQEKRLREMNSQTEQLEQKNQKLKMAENTQCIVTDGVILIAGVLMAAVCGYFAEQGTVSADQAMVAVIAMISSFGPTAALSALSNNLQHTLASGNRVLDILEEEPLVEDVLGGSTVCEGDISCEHVSFAYESALTKEGQKGAQAEFTKEDKVEIQAEYKKSPNGVLENFDHVFAEHKIHGILGKSGCGKSTLLKLLMRFYETSEGDIRYGKRMSVRFRLRHCAAAFPTSHRRHSCLRIRSKITSKLQKRMQAGKKLLQRQKKRHCMNLSCHCRMAMTRS